MASRELDDLAMVDTCSEVGNIWLKFPLKEVTVSEPHNVNRIDIEMVDYVIEKVNCL